MKKASEIANTVRLYLTGFAMGSADIVPGVSGGTIAFIFGIYEELIESIKTLSGKTLKLILRGNISEAFNSVPFKFLIPLAFGIFSALLLLANLISYLLAEQPVYVWSFFFGLVLISVYVVSKRIVKWGMIDIIALIISSIAAYIVVGAVPVETPSNLFMFFISGAIAICAMILPGISGSFLLVIMGKYEQVLNALKDRDIVTLGVFMLGCIIGIAVFSRVLSWLFAKHHDLVIAILTGLMIGSLRKVWPWKEVLLTRVNSHGEIVPVVEKNILPPAYDISFLFALLLCIAAIFLILYLEKFSVTKEHIADLNDKDFIKSHNEAVKPQNN